MLSKANSVRDFTSGKMLPQILMFALPIAATSVLQLAFNTADTVVVGRWGGATPDECETALAAVGSCGSLSNLILGLFTGLSVGAGVTVAHDVGARRYDDLRKTVHTSVLLSLVLGVFVGVLGMLIARPVLAIMGTDPRVLDQAAPYMIAVFAGMPGSLLYNYLSSILRSAGDSSTPLKFLTIAGVVNVGLNLIMVLVFKLGAIGVGIATAASSYVSGGMMLIYMTRMEGPCRIDLRNLRLDGRKLRKIVLIGLPAGVQGCVFSISNVLIQSSINSFDKAVVAGNTAAMNIDSYVYNIQNGFYHGAMTFVGQNLGAGDLRRVKRSVGLSSLLVSIVGFISGSVAYAFGPQLLSIFAPGNTAVIDAGMIRLTYVALPYFLCGLFEVACGALRGMGKSVSSTLCSLFGACALRIIYILTVFVYFHRIDVLYMSYPITWIITAVLMYSVFAVSYRRIKRRVESAESKVVVEADPS